MQRLSSLGKRHKLLLSAFVAAMAVTLFFAVRFALWVLYWNDPAHRNQPLEDWMTIGYIAHSYDVPRDALIDALHLKPPEKGKRPTIESIAADRGQTPEAFEAEIQAAIERLREEGTGR